MIADAYAPTPTERQEFQARLAALQASMKGGGSENYEIIKTRTVVLLTLFGGERIPETADAYAAVLCEYPIWAIDKAFKAIVNSGEKFRPSCPEIIERIKKEFEPLLDEVSPLWVILNAEVYKTNLPSERERVKAKFKEFTAEIAETNAMERAKERGENPMDRKDARKMPPGPERDAVIAHHEAKIATYATTPLKLSDEARERYFKPAFEPPKPDEFDNVDF